VPPRAGWQGGLRHAGNFPAGDLDYPVMTCDDVRVALSARLDGEDPGVPAPVLDAHTAGCPACRSWVDRAERAKRALRVQVADVPDLTASVLAAVAADPQAAAAGRAALARGRRQVLRVAVAIAAVAQVAVALPLLLPGLGVVDPHTSREMASFDIALAVGFALAAYRPERARAFVPVALVLAVCLAATSAVDVATSTTALVHEVGHLTAVAQAALLWALGRADRPAARPGATAMAAGRW
jgi:predicted anti-sigma-YlaC factor YlaD